MTFDEVTALAKAIRHHPGWWLMPPEKRTELASSLLHEQMSIVAAQGPWAAQVIAQAVAATAPPIPVAAK